jgi:hypothetical protein
MDVGLSHKLQYSDDDAVQQTLKGVMFPCKCLVIGCNSLLCSLKENSVKNFQK